MSAIFPTNLGQIDPRQQLTPLSRQKEFFRNSGDSFKHFVRLAMAAIHETFGTRNNKCFEKLCLSLLKNKLSCKPDCKFAHHIHVLFAKNILKDPSYKTKVCTKNKCIKLPESCPGLHLGDLRNPLEDLLEEGAYLDLTPPPLQPHSYAQQAVLVPAHPHLQPRSMLQAAPTPTHPHFQPRPMLQAAPAPTHPHFQPRPMLQAAPAPTHPHFQPRPMLQAATAPDQPHFQPRPMLQAAPAPNQPHFQPRPMLQAAPAPNQPHFQPKPIQRPATAPNQPQSQLKYPLLILTPEEESAAPRQPVTQLYKSNC